MENKMNINECHTFKDFEKVTSECEEVVFNRIKEILDKNPKAFQSERCRPFYRNLADLVERAEKTLFIEQNKDAIQEYRRSIIDAVQRTKYDGLPLNVDELVGAFKNLLEFSGDNFYCPQVHSVEKKIKTDDSFLREILMCMAAASPYSLQRFIGTLVWASVSTKAFGEKLTEEGKKLEQETSHDPAP